MQLPPLQASAIRRYGAIALVLGIALAAPAASAQSRNLRAERGIDLLNAHITLAYREHDHAKYGALFTDSAIFEWPAIPSVRGRAALTAMARENWASLRNMDLRLVVASRLVAGNRATEFGAFEQSWDDDKGARNTEFGRYAAALVRQKNGAWLMDRFLGFEDSTRARPRQ